MQSSTRGLIVKDWSRLDLSTVRDRALVNGALNHFLAVPRENAQIRAAIQSFTTKDDFPANVLQVLDKFKVTLDWDEGWRSVFDVIDFTSSQVSGFSILDVEDTLTFNEVPVGEAAKVYKMKGSKVDVEFAMYSAGLDWPRTLFDDAQYWTIEDNAAAFRNEAYRKRSEVFYALIDAIGSGQNLAWQAIQPAGVTTANENYDALRDMITINVACQTILLALKDSSIPVTPKSSFVLLHPIQLTSRMKRALGVQNVGISAQHRTLNYNVTLVPTMMLSASDKYYVCLPKQKAKAGIRLELEVFGEFSAARRSECAFGWTRYGGAIGNSTQFMRCSTADD